MKFCNEPLDYARTLLKQANEEVCDIVDVSVDDLVIFLFHRYVRYCHLGLSDILGGVGGTKGLDLNHLVGLFYPEIGSDPFHYVPPGYFLIVQPKWVQKIGVCRNTQNRL